MHEFRPPERRPRARLLLAVVLVATALIPLVTLVSLATGFDAVAITLRGGTLDVHTGAPFTGDRSVRLADVRELRLVDLRGGRRVAGTALPGYCVGRFHYPDLGTVWQATECGGRAVLVRADGEELPLLLGAPDPEALLAQVRSGEEGTVVLAPPDKRPIVIVALILVPALLLTVGMLGTLLLAGPGRMLYVVGGGSLAVRTLFGRQEWPLAGARARTYTPSRLWRTAGTAAPGYVTGRFREGGRPTRVYATDVKEPMVLFESEGVRVLLSPRNREGFLAALHQEGAAVEGHGG
jgi:hypothetical protein